MMNQTAIEYRWVLAKKPYLTVREALAENPQLSVNRMHLARIEHDSEGSVSNVHTAKVYQGAVAEYFTHYQGDPQSNHHLVPDSYHAELATLQGHLDRIVTLTCPCCGHFTLGRQWINLMDGEGLCEDCIDECSEGTDLQSFRHQYGIRGLHYAVLADMSGGIVEDDSHGQ